MTAGELSSTNTLILACVTLGREFGHLLLHVSPTKTVGLLILAMKILAIRQRWATNAPHDTIDFGCERQNLGWCKLEIVAS